MSIQTCYHLVNSQNLGSQQSALVLASKAVMILKAVSRRGLPQRCSLSPVSSKHVSHAFFFVGVVTLDLARSVRCVDCI